jgi:hypothetical protein
LSNRLCAAILLLPLALAGLACSREQAEAPADATAQAPAAAPAPATPAPALEPDRYPKQTFEGEEGARKFVQAFMRSRLRGNPPRARALMSPEALAQYNTGQGGLQLMPASGQEFTEWEFGSVEAADASAFEVQVQIQASPGEGGADSVFSETLFVGPGPDFQGVQRPWVIRGAQRAALDPNQ